MSHSKSQIFGSNYVTKKCFQSEIMKSSLNSQNKYGIKILSSNFGNPINNQNPSVRNYDFNQNQTWSYNQQMPNFQSNTTNQDQKQKKFFNPQSFNSQSQITTQDSCNKIQNRQQQFSSKLNQQQNLIPEQQQLSKAQSQRVFEPYKKNLFEQNTNPSINLQNQIPKKQETQQKLQVESQEQQKHDNNNFNQPVSNYLRNEKKEQNYSYVDQSLFQRVYQQRSPKIISDEIEQDYDDPMVVQLYVCWNCNNVIEQQSFILSCLHRYHIECLLEIVQNQIQNGQILIKCHCQKKIPYKQIQQIVSEQQQNLLEILDKSIFNNLIKQLPKSCQIKDQQFSILK